MGLVHIGTYRNGKNIKEVITGTQLKKVATTMSIDRATSIAAILTAVCPKYGINTADILHEFLSNLLHECGEFTRFSEGLNYQAEALVMKFGRHRISVDDCYRYGRIRIKNANGTYSIRPANQQMIANLIYGGQWGLENLGNKQQGDGWLMRGAGPIQLTGRANITAFANYYNKLMGTSITPEAMADLLRTNIEIGIHGSAWFFAVYKGLIDEAIDDKFLYIVKKINGGTIGFSERTHYYELCKKYIPIAA